MSNIINPISKYISALLAITLFLPVSLYELLKATDERIPKDIAYQIQHIEELKAEYASPDYVPVDENSFCDFDYNKALRDGTKFNEIANIATHNSYQTESEEAFKRIRDNVATVTFGLASSANAYFKSETLTEQFNKGIRSIELDIETVVKNNEVSFVCSHEPVVNSTSSCYDFALALEEIKMWSDANPNHIPITVIIEPKKSFTPEPGMRYMNLKYINELDKQLRRVLGDKLLTPAKMMGKHSSLLEMRTQDDWLTLDRAAGHVLFLLHDTTVTKKYISQDSTVKSQAMFPMLRYKDRDKDYASFLLMNEPEDILKDNSDVIFEKKLIVRTRADSYGSYNDKTTENAFLSNAQIISTDYPPRTDSGLDSRIITFADGKTIMKIIA